MKRSLTVDYEELVSSYQEAILTQLRGFQGGGEYLETWVPDDDPLKSLLNLVDAAGSAGAEEVSISVRSSTLGSVDLDKLAGLIGDLGTLETGLREGGAVLRVIYA